MATIAGAEKRAVKLLGAARQIAAARIPEHRGSTNLKQCLPELRSRFNKLEIIVVNDSEPLPLARSGLQVVLAHLTENAQEAGATKLTLDTGRGENGPWMTVCDNGPGISQGNAAQVFEPFFTTRRDQGGTGMGLAIVQTMLLAHGNLISIEEPHGDFGTCFRIQF